MELTTQQLPLTSSLSGPKILPSTLFWSTLNLCSLLYVTTWIKWSSPRMRPGNMVPEHKHSSRNFRETQCVLSNIPKSVNSLHYRGMIKKCHYCQQQWWDKERFWKKIVKNILHYYYISHGTFINLSATFRNRAYRLLRIECENYF